MIIKPDHHTCTECGVEYHHDHDWKRNSSDELVCCNCAEELPSYRVNKVKDYGFYGSGKMLFGVDAENLTTRFFKTKEETRLDVVRMCQKQWGNGTKIKPIDEDAV